MLDAIRTAAAGMSPVAVGTLGSLIAGLFSGIGALPVLLGRELSPRYQNALLGFAAGVMLAATAYSLMLPSLERGAGIYGSPTAAALAASLGMFLGAGAIALVHSFIPHEHFLKGREGEAVIEARRIARLWLFVIAITLHNFPEGLAVGVGFGGGDIANGTALAIGIGLQNAPEGLAVAVALIAIGYGRWRATGVAFLTGLVEPIGGLAGAAGVSFAEPLLPVGLAFAGGSMLYVISHEIIPETHRSGSAGIATAGLMVGFVTMMNLDVLLG